MADIADNCYFYIFIDETKAGFYWIISLSRSALLIKNSPDLGLVKKGRLSFWYSEEYANYESLLQLILSSNMLLPLMFLDFMMLLNVKGQKGSFGDGDGSVRQLGTNLGTDRWLERLSYIQPVFSSFRQELWVILFALWMSYSHGSLDQMLSLKQLAIMAKLLTLTTVEVDSLCYSLLRKEKPQKLGYFCYACYYVFTFAFQDFYYIFISSFLLSVIIQDYSTSSSLFAFFFSLAFRLPFLFLQFLLNYRMSCSSAYSSLQSPAYPYWYSSLHATSISIFSISAQILCYWWPERVLLV